MGKDYAIGRMALSYMALKKANNYIKWRFYIIVDPKKVAGIIVTTAKRETKLETTLNFLSPHTHSSRLRLCLPRGGRG